MIVINVSFDVTIPRLNFESSSPSLFTSSKVISTSIPLSSLTNFNVLGFN